MAAVDCVFFLCMAASRVGDDQRAYVGAEAVEAADAAEAAEAVTPDPAEQDASQKASAAEREPNASTTIVRIDDADRWRFAFTLHTMGVVAIGNRVGLGGAGVGAYLGVGFPRQSQARYARHSFGVASELTYSILPRSAIHRHRVAASGLLWRDTSFSRRYLSLYYFAGAGAAIHDRSPGGSIGGRVGLASSRDLHYIMALGIDLDLVRAQASQATGMALIFSLSLLAFGML